MRRTMALGATLALLLTPTAAWAQYGGDDGGGDISSTSLSPGGDVTVTVDNAQPGSDWSLTFESQPTEIASGTAGSDGTIEATGTVPEGAEAGEHTVRLSFTDASGDPAEETFAVTVVGEAGEEQLAATGSSTGDTLRTAGTIGVVGLVLLGIAAQRQRARAGRASASA